MDASQYKDYVLFMLFIKYITDKYGNSGDFAPPVTIPKGASFKDMIALKGKSDIGDKINTQVIQPLIDASSKAYAGEKKITPIGSSAGRLIAAAAAGMAPKTPLLELPVLNDIPKCRAWAARVGSGADYQAPVPPLWTRRLDATFLHPLFGPLIFLLVVAGVFQTIFSGARPLMDALQGVFSGAGDWIGGVLPDSIFRSLLTEGVLSGVGSVVVFLPQILILFLFILLLEDLGYMARAAFLMDRIMGGAGHLSNEQSLEAVRRIDGIAGVHLMGLGHEQAAILRYITPLR